MSKIQLGVPAVVKDGKEVDLTAVSSGGSSYSLIAPDYYTAQVKSIKQEIIEGKYKDKKPPKGSKGWSYLKLQPEIELLNENRTLINRQQITVGVIKDGALYRPDEDGKSAMWPDAQYFLNATGLLVKAETGYTLDFDPDFIASRIIRVKTSIAGYRKKTDVVEARNFQPKDLIEFLEKELGESVDLTHGVRLVQQVEAFNDGENLIGEDGKAVDGALKLKNIITNYYPMPPKDAEEQGYFVDWSRGTDATPAIFVSEKDYELYQWHLDNPDVVGDTAF